MTKQQYENLLTSVSGEMQEVSRQNDGSIFNSISSDPQFALFKSAKHPGVYALVFGWRRDGFALPSRVELTLLVDESWKPLSPELVQKVEPAKPSSAKLLADEYQNLVMQFQFAARSMDFFNLFVVAQKIVALQNRARNEGIDPNLFPVPSYAGGGK